MIFLTGATGFIGACLNESIGMARCVIRTEGRNSDFQFYKVDSIDGRTSWEGAFEGITSIIHLAGVAHNRDLDPQYIRSVNTLGTLRLAKEASKAGVKRFVYVSSIGVNGTSTEEKYPYEPTSSPEPNGVCAKSKYEAELGLKKIAEETGLEVVIVRSTLVYGPRAPGNFAMLKKLVGKLCILPFGSANNRRDFIAVHNLADLLLTCAVHPDAAGHTFLASDGETVSIKQFTNAIANGVGKGLVQLPIPVSFMQFTARLLGKSVIAEQLFGSLEVDSSNAQEVLDWIPPYTMEQTMASLSENKK